MMTFKSSRRSYFTLMELLVVLLLTSVGMAVTGIKIKETYDQQRYLGEVQQVLSHLQMAQDIMLVLKTDIQIKFKKDSDKIIHYQLFSESPLPVYIANLLKGDHSLKAIRWMRLNEQSTDNTGITLNFFSKGMVMSKGLLILSQDSEGKDESNTQIELAGHPRFIETRQSKTKSYEEDAVLQDLISKELYPKIIFEEQNKKINEPKK